MEKVCYLKNVADLGHKERVSVRVEASISEEDLDFFKESFEGVAGKPISEFLKSKVTAVVLQQFYLGDKEIGPDDAWEDYYYTVFTEDASINWVTLTGSAPPNAWVNHKLVA